MQVNRAIMREVSDNYRGCISDHPGRIKVDPQKAREQHSTYKKTLEGLGIEVMLLPQLNHLPDSCFVEDNAIIYGKRAFLARMGVKERVEETREIVDILSENFSVKTCTTPGTIEGGDVIHLPGKLISGVSKRTNLEGISQAQKWLNVPIETIEALDIMHLKSFVTYLDDSVFMATERFASHPLLAGYDVIRVPDDESYAANSLTINGVILVSHAANRTLTELSERGFETIQLDMRQFEYCNGALTCLSLLF